MSGTADVVVIGGGLNGAATAYYLSQMNAGKVVVVTGTKTDRSSSRDSVGLLRTHHDNRPEAALAAASMQVFANWEQEFGTTCGWVETGFVRFVGQDEVGKMQKNVAVQRELGVDVTVLAPNEIGQHHPYFALDGVGAAVYEPNAGTADAWLCTLGFLRACRDTTVSVMEVDAVELIVDHSGVRSVRTSDGRLISTRAVVLAAGAWSKALAQTAGLDLPLQSRAISFGEILLPPDLARVSSYMDPLTDSWFTPRMGGRGMLTLMDSHTSLPAGGDSYDMAVAPQVYAEGVARVAKRIPAVAGLHVERAWTRLDTYAPDGKPVIGAADGVAGLFLNVAGAGKGHKVAPAIGRSLAQTILGLTASVPIADFDIKRFLSGGFPSSELDYSKRTIG